MKKIVYISGILFSLFLIVVIVLEFVVDLDSYKGQVTEPLAKSLHRSVNIGEISHTLLRGPGATIQDVTISNVDSHEAFVHIKSIIARLRLFPLLAKKIAISKIILDEPVVLLTRSREGTWNIDDLLGHKAEASPLPTPGKESPLDEPGETPVPQETGESKTSERSSHSSPPPTPPSSGSSQLAIDSFRVRNGTVRVVDELLDVTTEFTSIKGDARGIAAGSPMKFKLSTRLAQGTQGTIEVAGEIGEIPVNGNIENLGVDISATLSHIDVAHFTPYYQLAQLRQDMPHIDKLDATLKLVGNLGTEVSSTGNVSVGGISIDVEGNVKEAKRAPNVDLTISSNELPWEKLVQLLPPNIAKPLKNFGLSGLGTLTIQPKGPLDNLVLSGEFDLSKSGILYQNFFAKPKDFPMTLTFDLLLQKDSLTISTCQLVLGKVRLDVAGTVAHFQQPELDLELSSNAFPLRELLERVPKIVTLRQANSDERAVQAEGLSQLHATVKGTLDALGVQAKLELDQCALTYANMFQKAANTPGNLVVEAQVGPNAVSFQKLVLHLGDFQINGSGKVADFAIPVLDVQLETNRFDLGALFAHFPILTTQYLPSELTLEGAGKLRLASSGPLDKLTLSGFVDMSGGKIAFGEYFSKPKNIPGVIEFETLLTKDAVTIRRFQTNVNGVLLNISGDISGLGQQTMLDLSLSSNRFALNQLLPVAGMEMTPTGTTEFQAVVRGPLNQLDAASLASARCRLVDVGFQVPSLGKPVKALQALVELQGQTLTIRQFSGNFGESSLGGTVEIAEVFTHPDIGFVLHSGNLNVDELLEQTGLQSMPGKADSPFIMVADRKTVPHPMPQSPPQDSTNSLLKVWSLPNLTAHGMIAVEKGVAKNIHFSGLTADVVMNEQVLTVDNLIFSLYDGRYEGGGRVDFSIDEPKYALHSALVEVDANRVLSDGVSLADVVYGGLFAKVSLRGQGFRPEQMLDSLSGKGAIKITKGYFSHFDIWPQLAEIFTLLGSVGRVDVLTQMGRDFAQLSQEMHFSRLEGSFKLHAGKAGSSDMILEIPGHDMHLALLLDGELGLNTSLDFLGTIRFAPQSKYYKDLKKYFHDFLQNDGSIELPFPIPIGGTLLKPEMNLQSVQHSLIKFAGEIAKQSLKSQVKNAAKSELKKVGKSLFKNLFK